ncbi:MAG TPA: ATP-binding protein, partial [Allosphingosinicella sp.]
TARHRAEVQILILSARLGDGEWLNGRFLVPRRDPYLALRLGLSTLLLYLIVLGATLLIARRLARPLRELTEAAERFQGKEDVVALEPTGPDDLRRAITAFNAMSRRVVGLLDEKDRMLGAIGHDLRTPLASLRIRAENMEPEEERAKMAATIAEMTATLEDILALARSGRSREEARPMDVAALADALAEEYGELGRAVTFAPSERQVLDVQPTLLRRALRNLIDNALQYAGAAELSVRKAKDSIEIAVEDRGPGLPPEELERVLEPFHRLEVSRSRETGGSGLGLAIARAVAESHGGTLCLANRHGGGLSARLILPARS